MTYSESATREAFADMALRSKVLHYETKDLMRPDFYAPPRDLLGWPTKTSSRVLPVITRFAVICDGSPKTPNQAKHRADYALCLELGQRAYDALVGKAPKRGASSAKRRSTPTVSAPREHQAPIVLSDHDLMARLGIKPIGYLD